MIHKRLEIIRKKYGMSKSEFARRLNVVGRTFSHNMDHKRDDKLCYLAYVVIDVFPEISRDWIFFGEGPMLAAQAKIVQIESARKSLPSPPVAALPPGGSPPHTTPAAVPLMGLASCGIQGWEQVMPFPVSAAIPGATPHMVAVIASGDSMAPAGIASGHICFCDPDQNPIPGDAVYVVKKDGMGAIKQFLGEGAEVGEDLPPDHIRLQGWRSPVNGLQPDTFTLDIAKRDVKTLATVVFMKRRL